MDKEFRTIDKTEWPHRGAWDTEPDKVAFVDRLTSYRCVIARGRAWGNLCGYVAVPIGHPAHGVRHKHLSLPTIRSLSWSQGCEGDTRTGPTCGGDPCPGGDHLWWIGFDCAHGYDFCPAMAVHLYPGQTYRDITMVRGYVRELCQALSQMGVPVKRGLARGKSK